MRRIRTIIGALAAGLLIPAPAAGETGTGEGLPLWELGIGAALYHQASYPGADVRSTSAFPFPYVIYRGDWLRIDRSLQGILYETRRLQVDFTAGGTSLVDNDESDARIGMPDLDPTIQVGPALSVLLSDPERFDSIWGRIALRGAVSADTGDWVFEQQGWVLDGRLRYQRPVLGERLKLSIEIGTSFVDDDYAGYFYDVAPDHATPGRPAYRADSGYAGSRLGLGLNGVAGRWRWSLFGAYSNLAGTAFAGSPLLDSEHDFSLGATVGWMFWRSERRVVPANTSPGGDFETPLFGL